VTPSESFAAILKKVREYLPGQDTRLLEKAFIFSQYAHGIQQRAGGDPYITHPLAVADLLADLRLDIPTLAASLLHDVLEDTPTSTETLRSEFGDEITHLVEGVTKVDALPPPELGIDGHGTKLSPEIIHQAENWRKMLVATAHDVRVIVLKLADRRHNMETLGCLSREKQKRIAEETLTLYAPIAQRLGMYKLKSALEDLSIKALEPEIYAELLKKTADEDRKREDMIRRCTEKLEAVLSAHDFPCRVLARPKNIYSIYRKMIRQNKPFEEIQDQVGIRLITDSVEHCYALLGAVQTNFEPVEGSFTDYIAMPKTNFYQSLHTTVRLSPSEIFEIQIRTEAMHRVSEYGVAAHWRYKQEAHGGGPKDSFEDKLDWIKQIMEWQQETQNPKEFLEGLKVELDFDQVFVFTPKGEVKKLPAGSTPVDFAFSVHTDLGWQCVGAKVNDKMVRLDYQLKSGDRCEILTRKGQKPHKDWLEFVKTPRARSKIRKFLKENSD
jgi:GTP pyrophosphokinase